MLRISPEYSDSLDGLPTPQRTLAFLTVAVAVIMAVLDGAIINVALPTIAREQQVQPSAAIWVITAYQLALVVSLLPLAALGEAVGFRRVYTGGILVFTVSSLVCALAPSIEILSIARVAQGLGAGALMSINGALIRHIMPAKMLGRGIAGISLVVGVSAAAGPTIAAGILAVASWHWLFLINIPLGIIVMTAGLVFLPKIPGSGLRFDFVSAVLNALTFGFLISGLSSIGKGDIVMVGVQFLIAAVAGLLLSRRQLSRPSPMLPIDLLRRPVFTQSVIASICSFVAQFLAFVGLPFFFHDVLGRSEVQTGLLLTPWPVATALIAPFAGRLADRVSPDWLGAIGMGLFAIGLALVAFLPDNPSDIEIMVRLLVCGVGFGLFQAPNNKVMITSAPRHRAGGASGTQSTARVLGQSIGAALAALIIGMFVGFNLMLLMLTASGFAAVAALACFTRGPNRDQSMRS